MARRGRKPKLGIARTPKGRASTPVTEIRENTKAVVIIDRMRRYGLTAIQADSDLAGYAIGRMAIKGAFGTDWTPSIMAVTDYVEAVADYMRIKFPGQPMLKAMDYLAGKGTSLKKEPNLKTVDRIVTRYERLIAKLQAADGWDRAAFHDAAFRDEIYSPRGEEAVKRCVQVLLGGK